MRSSAGWNFPKQSIIKSGHEAEIMGAPVIIGIAKALLPAIAVAASGYGLYNHTTSEDACYLLLNCAKNTIFHKVIKTPDGYRNADGKDAIADVTKFGTVYGWHFANEADRNHVHKVAFKKAWIEFDDNGRHRSPPQKEAVIDYLRRASAVRKPFYVVVYIHGWHNSADDTITTPDRLAHDALKSDFLIARQVNQASRLFEQRGSREVPAGLGIYIGWRGDSITTWGLKNITIGNRAAVADVIATRREQDSLYATLQDIARTLREIDPRNRMLIIGHSLGGRILSRLLLDDLNAGKSQPFGAGTLAVALEPAIGADCFDGVLGKGNTKDAAEPAFISITNKDDGALKDWYRRGRFFRLIKDCDHSSNASGRALGAYGPYLTHRMYFEHLDSDKTMDLVKHNNRPGWEEAAFPPVNSSNNWFQQIVNRTYAFRDRERDCKLAHVERCFRDIDVNAYSMTFAKRAEFTNVSAMWNIETNKNTIGVDGVPVTSDPDHNGIVSTNLARAFAEWLWRDQPVMPAGSSTERRP